MADCDLAAILHPYSVEDFRKSYYGQRMLCVSGQSRNKFEGLLSWPQVNEIVGQMCHTSIQPGMLRLLKNGRDLFDGLITKDQSLGQLPTLITQGLGDGATLVINKVDQVNLCMSDFLREIERELQCPTTLNAYIACGSEPGFDMHCDGHDVLILQVCGTKKWSVYGPTVVSPMENYRFLPRPVGPPSCEVNLDEGDCLYLPRGWWHSVTPIGKPTVHLTLGIHPPTGIDYIQWLCEKLKREEVFRKDLHRLVQDGDRENFKELAIERLRGLLQEDDSIDMFATHRASVALPRPSFSFPHSIAPESIEKESGLVLANRSPYQAVLVSSDDSIDISLGGRMISYDRSVSELIEAIVRPRSILVDDLLLGFAGRFSEGQILEVAVDLARNGVVEIRTAKRTSS